jgi:hypothetical protein
MPALTGLHQGGKHQLQTAFFIPETGDGLGSAALLLKGTLDEIGGAENSLQDLTFALSTAALQVSPFAQSA